MLQEQNLSALACNKHTYRKDMQRGDNIFSAFNDEPNAFIKDVCALLKQHFPALLTKNTSQNGAHARALDIACGNAKYSKILAQLGFFVSALDYSSAALSHIDNPRIHHICIDIESYAFPHNYYDVIFNRFFLQRTIFPQIVAALKPNGIVIFETFIDIYNDIESYIKPSIKSSADSMVLYANELERIFSVENGFCILMSRVYKNTCAQRRIKCPHIVQFIAQYSPKVATQ